MSGLRARLCVCAEKIGRVELIVRCPESDECVDDGKQSQTLSLFYVDEGGVCHSIMCAMVHMFSFEMAKTGFDRSHLDFVLTRI